MPQTDRCRFTRSIALFAAGAWSSLSGCTTEGTDGEVNAAADVLQDVASDVDSEPGDGANGPDQSTADSSTDAAADAAADADAEVNADTDADDASVSVDPVDPVQAQATLERVFASMGLDPSDPGAVRSVWETPELFEVYLTAWQADRGVVFERRASNKAECAALGSFDDSVPYCGPGCGNSTTVAPPCLNRGCFEHDACYASIECRSGLLIDVGLSFSALTACCDAPLAPSREACAVEVSRGLIVGEVSVADAHLFAAVAAIMVAVETSPLLDSSTDRAPATCDESFDTACGPGEIVVDVSGPPVAAGSSVQVCATLTRGGRPVDVWRFVGGTPGVGAWTTPATDGRGSEAACLVWTAPSDLGGEGTVEVVVSAEVLGEQVASAPVSIALDIGPVSLFAENAGVTEAVQVGQSRLLCFTAQRPDGPAAGAVVQFAVAGTGSLDADSRVAGSSGRACVTYIAPAAVPAGLDIVRASVGDVGATVPVEVVAGVVFEGDAIIRDDIGAPFWDTVEVITGGLAITGATVVELDRLRRVSNLTIRDNDTTVVVRMPALQEIDIDLTVADTTISAGTNASLATVELPALRLIGRRASVDSNPSLTQLVLGGSSLRVLGSVQLTENAVLASVDGIGSLVIDDDLLILQNPILSSVSISSLLERATVGRNTSVSGNGP